MKRFIGVALLVAMAVGLAVSTSSAQTLAPRVQPLTFRHFNNSGANAALTVPNPLDSMIVTHSAARLDTTLGFPLMLCHVVGPLAGAVGADSSYHFTLTWAPSPSQQGLTSSTTDSVYYTVQFSENGINWVTAATTIPVLCVAGTHSRVFNSMKSCTYSTASFEGAQLVRFIFTSPANGAFQAWAKFYVPSKFQ